MITLNDMEYQTIVAKRKNPYKGNDIDPEQFADGGMACCKSCGGKMAKGGMSCAQGCKMAEGGVADKKKAAVMAIVAKIGKKPMGSQGKSMEELSAPEVEVENEMPVSEEAKMAAAEEVMNALKGGDVKAFAGALENFLSCCSGMED